MKIKEIWQSLISSYTFNVFAWCAYADLLNIWIQAYPLGLMSHPWATVIYIFLYVFFYVFRSIFFIISFIIEQKYSKQTITNSFVLNNKIYAFLIIVGAIIHICALTVALKEVLIYTYKEVFWYKLC